MRGSARDPCGLSLTWKYIDPNIRRLFPSSNIVAHRERLKKRETYIEYRLFWFWIFTWQSETYRVQTILILKEIYGSLRVPSYTLKLEKARTQKGVLIPLDYWCLAGLASEEDDAHSAITESYTFSAFVDDKLAANMAGMHAMDYRSMLKVRSSKCNKNQSMRLKIC